MADPDRSAPEDRKPNKTPHRYEDLAHTIARLTPNAQAARAALEQLRAPTAPEKRRTLRTLLDPMLNEHSGDKGKGRAVSDQADKDEDVAETTFQPRIAGPSTTTGPAHRQTMAQDTTQPMVPMALMERLINEMREQRLSDQLQQRKVAEQMRKKAEQDEHDRVSNRVSAISKRITESQKLQPDGSNLRAWERMLQLHAKEQFDDMNFFVTSAEDPGTSLQEKVALGIINNSIHQDLAWDVLSLDSASEVYKKLVSKFRMTCRAAQMNAFDAFIDIDITLPSTNASLFSAFNDSLKTLAESGIGLSIDELMGLVLQRNLRNTEIQPILDRKVEIFMGTNDSRSPSFNELMTLLDAARTKLNAQENSKKESKNVLKAEIMTQEAESRQTGDLASEIEVLAVDKTPYCYICKSLDHMAPNCPRKRRGTANPPFTAQNTTYRPRNPAPAFPPCSITYNFDKAPYVRPLQPGNTSSSTASHTQSSAPNNRQISAPPTATKKVDTRMINPDLFAEEQEETYIFENEELSAEPVVDRFDLRAVNVQDGSQEVIWDTSASDNVTGDRYGYLEISRDELNNHRF